MIGFWALLVVLLPLFAPSLTEMAQRHPVAVLPADAPSVEAAAKVSAAFDEDGSENVLTVLLTDDQGLDRADEKVYRALVDRLRLDTEDVVMLQDFHTTPALREVLVSSDGKAWILPVGLAGDLGTPEAYAAYARVAGIVKETVAGSTLTADVTGPAATVADLTDAGAHDRLAIELAIGVLLLFILGVIYRNPLTMLLPLITIGVSMVAAQAAVATASLVTGMAVSNQAIVMLSALIAGVGTDYVVFLVSRYHDYIRMGSGTAEDCQRAVQRALASIGKVIAASAATVAITLLGMGFAKLGVFATVGPVLAIGIAVAFFAAVTLLPAILTLAGPRGWVAPRPERAARFWRRTGVRIVRRPKTYLVGSLALLLALGSAAGLIRFNYDDRKQLPASVDSSVGYAALDRHFPVNQTIPEYLLVQSPNDLRTPRALADMEQMAQRISQIPGVAAVRGVTRPSGESLEEARATYQAGEVGGQLGDAAGLIAERDGDLNRLTTGSRKLANGLGDLNTQVSQSVASVRSLVDALAYLQTQFGGTKTFGEIDQAARLVNSIRALGDALQVTFAGLASSFDWVDPVTESLDTSPTCDANPICGTARAEFHKLQNARAAGTLDEISSLFRQLQSAQPSQTLSSAVNGLSRSLQSASQSLHALGFDNPRRVQRKIIEMQNGTSELASAGRQVADGVQLLVDQTKELGLGLDTASAFLMTMGHDASPPSMAGFNVPRQVLATEEFRTLAHTFVSPDGHSVRYFIQTDEDPFSTKAMDQVNTILATAQAAQPNTVLADASISISGYPVTLRDIRDYYDRDIRLIVILTTLVVLMILTALLRSVIAPIYLVGSVIISYLSAIGLGALVFQVILGQQLHWSVPGLAFVVLVAVGADYNMLLASRLRDESPLGVRTSVIRTVGSTGAVITAAGLIFASAMFGLLFASVGAVVQGGFVIGAGILVDTFVVRSITVPAAAALLGRANWWPARPWLQPLPDNPKRSIAKGGAIETVAEA
ncbi:RND family transporter [Mycobacterium sp. SMC-14]|uniref:MMPL/RND family transporter n=1 Tax=Mycobacterium sp. SMC-14 TaxID=3385968 RepID=UPI00390CB1A7